MDLITLLAMADDIGWFVAPVAGWLMVAGEQGATKEDLIQTLGVEEGEITDALAILRSHGCLVAQGEGDRFGLRAHGYVSHVRGALSGLPGFKEFPILKFLNPNREKESAPKMKKIRITKNGTQKVERYPIDPIDPVKERKIKPKKIKITGSAQVIETTKISKHKTMAREGIDQIQGEKIARKKSDKAELKRYLDQPSTYPVMNCWRNKDNPNHWKAPDWIGYWLHLFVGYYGIEDPIFKGHRYDNRKTGVNLYLEHGFQAIQLRDSTRGFRGDGAGLKEYLDWLFTEFLPESEWMKTALLAKQAFKVRNNTFLDRFRIRSVKVKNRSLKPRGKWNPWGYSDSR